FNGIRGFTEEDGTLVISTRNGLRRFIDGKTKPYPLSGPGAALSGPLLRDRDGGLWMGESDRGLVHVHQGIADLFAEADGLSGNFVSAVLEDAEGSIWVATTGGLDRFRAYAATTLSSKQGLPARFVTSVLAARDGHVWIDTTDGLKRWENGRVQDLIVTGLPRSGGSLFQDSRGRIWRGTARGSGYLQDGRFIAVSGVGRVVRGIDEDTQGQVWIIDQERGLLRVSAQHAAIPTPWSAFGRQDFATALAADRVQGGLW